ncbi:hypothetical protein [Hyphomonas atlantica corrig.]|uniref:hypothetical protein n=1 Tax=Hyphomonas atlantica TaxID=1280948 RepID=UPI002356ED50|nr:hypothetical protein [Hyphomonas atlantica]
MELNRTYLADLAAELGLSEDILETAMERVALRRRLIWEAQNLGTAIATLPVMGMATIATGMARRFETARIDTPVVQDMEIGGDLSEQLPVVA